MFEMQEYEPANLERLVFYLQELEKGDDEK